MLIGMNRSEELKLHLRAAASNGVTRAEIKEVLMQSAINWASRAPCLTDSGCRAKMP